MRLTSASLLLYLASVSLGAAAQSPAAVAYAPTLEACPSGTSLVRQVGSNCALSSDPIATTGQAQDFPLVAGDHTGPFLFRTDPDYFDPMSARGKAVEPISSW